MSEPYRGFVELPAAVFQALQEVAEIIFTQAVEKGAPTSRSARPRLSLTQLLPNIIHKLSEYTHARGFKLLEVREVNYMTCFFAKHQCGAWGEACISDRAYLGAHSTRARFDLIMDTLDRLECYCVRPCEPCTPGMAKCSDV